MEIYVASSWRNKYQPMVVHWLREHGFDVYDFRNPGGDDHGFHWSEIDPNWQSWNTEDFIKGLTHSLAGRGYASDIAALNKSDAVVLVLPCGRSAHLEGGYAAGQDKPLVILSIEACEPELMYKMGTVVPDLDSVVEALKKVEKSS